MVANTPALVEVRNLRKDYGNQLAVKDVSFSFHGGEVLGLLGPNGAGKSTVMTMIAGLLAPTSGDVILNGEKYDGRRLSQRRLFGIVPQEYAIYQELSAINNLVQRQIQCASLKWMKPRSWTLMVAFLAIHRETV